MNEKEIKIITACIVVYFFINIFSFVFYGMDKKRAEKRLYRVSENKLIGLSFLGPFGAFVAMKFFRHKTKRRKFKIVIPLFIVLHIVCISIYYL